MSTQLGTEVKYYHTSVLELNIITLSTSQEELNGLLMVKEESEKRGLKLNFQKTKIMASSPIPSWQIDGETTETPRDFIFLGSKITAVTICSDFGAPKNKV